MMRVLGAVLLCFAAACTLDTPAYAQTPQCQLLDDDGCCGLACQSSTCAALATLGETLASNVTESPHRWIHRTGWQGLDRFRGGPGSACVGYLEAVGFTPAAPTATAPPYCRWHGITCNATQHSSTCSQANSNTYGISKIVLTNNNLVGDISDPAFLANLRTLHDCGLDEFVIGGASFGVQGTISPAFGDFKRLKVLAMFSTSISGTIPPQLGSMLNLEVLDISTNYITGTIPPEVGNLKNLRSLNLGYNGNTDQGKELYGTLPASFVELTNLEMLMLELNAISGALPPNMCTKMLKLQAVSMRNNEFHGSAMQFGNCHLTALDLSDNYFSGPLPRPPLNGTTWHNLQVLRLNNNNFRGGLPSFEYGEAPLLSSLIVNNNSLTGTIPISWTLLPWLTLVDASWNDLTGTLPWELAFQSKLSILSLNNNERLSGTISPWWRFTVGLSMLALQNTNLTGSLPGISRAAFAKGVVPLHHMCGSNASGLGRLPSLETASIASTQMSATCGGRGLCYTMDDALPWYLTVDKTAWQIPPPEVGFADNRNMECPMIYQDRFCRRNNPPQNFSIEERPRWDVSPSYYHYIGCRCQSGFTERWELAWHGDIQVSRLVCDKSLSAAEVAGISVVVSAVGLLLVAYAIYVSWSGRWGLPRLRRAYDDIKKRLNGAPTSGKLSLVVTDIESYSALMVAMPLVMGKAMSQHNTAIRKAAWAHFGSMVGQEGDSYLVAFREALDAVAFCLQVQQALQKIDWPPELLLHLQQQGSSQKVSPAAAAAAGTSSNIDSQQPAVASALPAAAGAAAAVSPLPSIDSFSVGAAPSSPAGCSSAPAAAGPGADTVSGTAGAPGAAGGSGSAVGGMGSSSPAGSALDLQCFSNQSSPSSSRLWPFRPFSQPGTHLPQPQQPPLHVQPEEGPKRVKSFLGSVRGSKSFGAAAAAAAAGIARAASAAGLSSREGQQQQAVSAVNVLIPGLRVRMGVASGALEDKEDCLACKVLEVARVVSDAASGGQVLMDSATFALVKDRLEELGQVGPAGYTHSSRVIGWGTPRGWLARLLARPGNSLLAEARVLDMGLYSIPGFRFGSARDVAGLLPDLPGAAAAGTVALQPSSRVLASTSGKATATAALDGGQQQTAAALLAASPAPPAGLFARDGSSSLQRIQEGVLAAQAAQAAGNAQPDGSAAGAAAPGAAAAVAAAAASSAGSGQEAAASCVRLYQVLAPKLLERAHLFGNKLSLKEGSLCYDLPYYCAPAAASRLHQQQQRGSGISAATEHQRRSSSGSSVFGDVLQSSLLSSDGDACFVAGSAEPDTTKGLKGLRGLWVAPSLAVHRAIGRTGSKVLVDGDAAVTFVFCSVITPRKLGMDVTPKLASQASVIVRRVMQHCLLALTSTQASNAAAAAAAGAAGAGAGAGLRAIGYLCRDLGGDLKYILAFNSPRVALEWCLLVQEALLWQDWPQPLLDKPGRLITEQPPNQQSLQAANSAPLPLPAAAGLAVVAGQHGQPVLPAQHAKAGGGRPLFRGPRIKMGVACGAPQAVSADHMGRADYHGNSINMAARYEAVCSQGGQVVCDAALAAAVVAEWADLAAAAAAAVAGPELANGPDVGSGGQRQQQQRTASSEQPPVSRCGIVSPFEADAAAAAYTLTGPSFTGAPLPVLTEHDNALPPPAAAAAAAFGDDCDAGNAAGPAVPSRMCLGDAVGVGLQFQSPPPTSIPARSSASEVSPSQRPSSGAAGDPLHVGGSPLASSSAPAASGPLSCKAAGGAGGAGFGGRSKGSKVVSRPSTEMARSGLASWLTAGSSRGLQVKLAGPLCRASASAVKAPRTAQRGMQPAALVLEPTPTELPCSLCVPQLATESFDVEVHALGRFIVKGHPGPVEVVEVGLAHLLAPRRLLLTGSLAKSQKGHCIEPQTGLCTAVAGVVLPGIAQLYRQQHEQRTSAAAAAAAAAGVAAQPSFSMSSGSLPLRQRSAIGRASSMVASIASIASGSRGRPGSLAGSNLSTTSGGSSIDSGVAALPQASSRPLQQQLGAQQTAAAAAAVNGVHRLQQSISNAPSVGSDERRLPIDPDSIV